MRKSAETQTVCVLVSSRWCRREASGSQRGKPSGSRAPAQEMGHRGRRPWQACVWWMERHSLDTHHILSFLHICSLWKISDRKKKISKTKFCRFASSFWRAGSPQLGGICAGLMQPHGSSRPAEARATCTPAPGPPSALPAHCCVSSRGLPEPCPLVSAPARPYPPLSIPMPAWCWGTESLKCTCWAIWPRSSKPWPAGGWDWGRGPGRGQESAQETGLKFRPTVLRIN